MTKLYFKQSWVLTRQNKLSSSFHVLGTGLVIAMIMIIVIVYYVKIAPIYPETNQSQTMVLTSVAVKNTEQHSMTKSPCSHHMLKEWIYPLKNAEEVTAVLGRMLLGNYVQPEDGGNVIPVMVKQTDPAFFRVFPLEFLGGQAFSQADFESGIHNVVLSESGARRILGDTEAVGRTFSLNFEDYRVVGVVRSGSYMLSDSYADVHMSCTCITGYDRGDKMANMVGPYQVFTKLPGADDAPKLRAEIQELVHKFNHSQPDLEIDLNNQPPLYWQYPLKQMGYSEIDWANVFKIYGWLLLAFLFVLAINLGGMISSRMEQRLSEMGIRKAFGANCSVLLGQVLWENLALTCVGGFIGLLLSWGGLALGRNWIFGSFNLWPVPIPEGVEVNLSPDMLFSPFVFVLAFGTCVLLNLLSVFCPAWYSLRKNITYSINEKIQIAMNQLILKNLWARRSRNLWLLAEIVLVCIVSWKIADPLAVLTHDRTLPEGFRSDHLLVLELATLSEKSGKFRPEEDDSLFRRENLGRILQQVKNYEGAESATFFFNHIMSYSGSSTTSPQTLKGDSTYMSVWQISFLNRPDFFRTMGFEGAEGMTAGELDERIFDKDEYVLTANTSEFFLHPESPLTGRTTWNNDSTVEYRAAGVIKPFRYRSYMQPQPVRPNLLPVTSERYYSDPPQIAFRIGDRLSEEVFLYHFTPWTGKELKAGNTYVNSVQSYIDLRKQSEFSAGTTDTYRKNITLGSFFLINLRLGVAGTFWPQTRTRREEVGIMLSSGARPQNIVRMLLGEGWVLTTIGTLLGCLVYLQYALKEGLYSTNWGSWSPEVASPAYWINHFGWYFLATSLMVYILLLIVVSVGIWIPARKISRINPVDALRDE